MAKMDEHGLAQLLGCDLAGRPSGLSLLHLGPFDKRFRDQVDPHLNDLLAQLVLASPSFAEHTHRVRRDVADHTRFLEGLLSGEFAKIQVRFDPTLRNSPFFDRLLLIRRISVLPFFRQRNAKTPASMSAWPSRTGAAPRHEAINSGTKGVDVGNTLYDHFLPVERCFA